MACVFLAYSGMHTQYSLKVAEKMDELLIGTVHIGGTTFVIYIQEMQNKGINVRHRLEEVARGITHKSDIPTLPPKY